MWYAYTAISRKVVGKKCAIHCSWRCSCRTYFCRFPLAQSQTYVHDLSCYSFKFLWKTVNSKPPTIPFFRGCRVHVIRQPFSNSCICAFVKCMFAWNGRMKRKWPHTWEKKPRGRKDRTYTWQKTARISCHNFETNGRPYRRPYFCFSLLLPIPFPLRNARYSP